MDINQVNSLTNGPFEWMEESDQQTISYLDEVYEV